MKIAIINAICIFGLIGCTGMSREQIDSNARSKASNEVSEMESRISAIEKEYEQIPLTGGAVFWRSKANAFEAYDNVIVKPPTFEFKERQSGLSSSEVNRLKQLLTESYKRQQQIAFSASGLVDEVVEASPCTLVQQLHLKDLQLYSPRGNTSQVSFVKSLGEVTIAMESRDSVTGSFVAAYIQHLDLGAGTTSTVSYSRLAEVISRAVDASYLATGKTIPLVEDRLVERAELGCKGVLGEAMRKFRE